MAKDPQHKKKLKAERDARAAAALRDNLKRRKAVRRAPEPEAPSGGRPKNGSAS